MTVRLQALSVTLEQHVEMNSSLAEDATSVILHKRHNVGVAMATPHGLVVRDNPLRCWRFLSLREQYCRHCVTYSSIAHKLYLSDLVHFFVTVWALFMLHLPQSRALQVRDAGAKCQGCASTGHRADRG